MQKSGPWFGAVSQVLLYGEVLDCKPSKSQWKIKACRTPNCSRANCGFLHPGEEAEGALFQLEVGLSEVSRHAQKEQKRFLEAADATAFKLLCWFYFLLGLKSHRSATQHARLQLVGVPVVDRQNLKLVEELPNKLRTRKGRESPIAAHLCLRLQQRKGQIFRFRLKYIRRSVFFVKD